MLGELCASLIEGGIVDDERAAIEQGSEAIRSGGPGTGGEGFRSRTSRPTSLPETRFCIGSGIINGRGRDRFSEMQALLEREDRELIELRLSKPGRLVALVSMDPQEIDPRLGRNLFVERLDVLEQKRS